jgi:hypothetical protein
MMPAGLRGAEIVCFATIAFCQIRIHICTFVMSGPSSVGVEFACLRTTVKLEPVPTCVSPGCHLPMQPEGSELSPPSQVVRGTRVQTAEASRLDSRCMATRPLVIAGGLSLATSA